MVLRHGQIVVIGRRLDVLEYHNIFVLKFDYCFGTQSGNDIAEYARFHFCHFALGTGVELGRK